MDNDSFVDVKMSIKKRVRIKMKIIIRKSKLERTLSKQAKLGGICVFGNTGKCDPMGTVFDQYKCLEGGYIYCNKYKELMRDLV